ncbi:MAG: 30S ribosomal protein S7 [Nitrospinota bacterium]
MPRRGGAERRPVTADAKYHDRLAGKFINSILRRGKKSVAESIFYEAMDLIEQRVKDDPLKVFKRAVDNVKPSLEVRSRRVGGSTYQVPIEVRPERRTSLAIRWIIQNAEARGRRMKDALAAELIEASNNSGPSVKKKEDTHRMAEANKAFAHYRW